MRRPVIKAIIFDFGNVLCTFDLMIFLRHMSPYTTEPLQDLGNCLLQSRDIGISYESGLITSDHFFETICRRCRLSVPKEIFRRAYSMIFFPIPTSFELVRALKPCYKLGLLSNTSEWHFEDGIRPVTVFPLFDAVTLSYVVKAMKPAREIYLDMLDKLDVDPDQCVYIDDLTENVEAASRLGMHAIHYTGHTPLLESLRSLHVRIS